MDKNLLTPFFAKDLPTGPFYADAVKIALDLSYHADSVYPKELIESARPNEDPKYKDYRKEVFAPITATYFDKVLNALSKIRRAEDWDICYPKEPKGSMPAGETLYDYCEKKYPFFDSVENWFFTLGFKHLLADPNAIIAIQPLPKKDPNNEAEYRRPYANIYPSSQALVFIENYFACVLMEEKTEVRVGTEIKKEGNVFTFFDKNTIEVWEQVGEKDTYTFALRVESTVVHNIDYLPVIRMGGKINAFKYGQALYDSFISACLPFWKEAIRRYSDHQVNMVLHLHPDRWEIEDSPCKTCNEKGSILQNIQGKDKAVRCPACGGSGSAPKTPWGTKMVKPVVQGGLNNSVAVPTPPMGYATRDIASIDFLKNEYRDNVKDGLSALNMEFLMEAPIAQSGVAKSYDMDGTFSFYNSVARHIVENILKPIYFFTNEYRYKEAISNPKDREHNLPDIAIPEQFDFVSSTILAQRIEAAKNGQFNPALRTALQIEYAEREFGKESYESKILKTIDQLDPIANRNEDEKMTILANEGCTHDDYILSSNIFAFVTQAISENPDFLDLDYLTKMTVVQGYVKKKSAIIKANHIPIVDPAGNPGTPNPPFGK